MTTDPTPSAPVSETDPVHPVEDDTSWEPDAPVEPRPETEAPAPSGPGVIDSTLRRGVALVAGIALIVGFFLPWRQATGLDAVSISGLDIVTKGLLVDENTRYVALAVPLCGLVLLVGGYVGRTTALVVSLIAGLSLVLVGAWQVLTYLAQSIGLGLWITAAAAFVAVIGGIPWQRMLRAGRPE